MSYPPTTRLPGRGLVTLWLPALRPQAKSGARPDATALCRNVESFPRPILPVLKLIPSVTTANGKSGTRRTLGRARVAFPACVNHLLYSVQPGSGASVELMEVAGAGM